MISTPSTLSLSEKIEARRTHSNSRILLASVEGSPANFDHYEWPEFVTEFTGGSEQFGSTFSANGGSSGASAVAEISKKRGEQLTANTNDVERSAESAVKEYVASKDHNSLHGKIEGKRKEHEKKLIEQNNKYWKDVEDAVKDLPEPEQDRAIGLADQVSKFAAWLWGVVSGKIIELAKKAWEWIKQAWESVKQWFVDRYNDVKNFFKNLFG